MKGNFPRRGFVVGAIAAAALALATGIAYSAIPDANSKVFTACMLKNVGTTIDPLSGAGRSWASAHRSSSRSPGTSKDRPE